MAKHNHAKTDVTCALDDLDFKKLDRIFDDAITFDRLRIIYEMLKRIMATEQPERRR